MQSRLFSYILELTWTDAVIQSVAAETCHQKIENAVVVVIHGGHGHSPAFTRQSGRLCDVFKRWRLGLCTVDLAIKGDHRIAAFFVSIDGRAVDRCDIEVAITVTIKDRRTS